MLTRLIVLAAALALAAGTTAVAQPPAPAGPKVEPAEAAKLEAKHLKNIRQVTSGFSKAGEGYFSPDGKSVIRSGGSAAVESARGIGFVTGCFDDVGRGRPSGAVVVTAGTPTFVFARLRILNMWPQLVHLTVTPPGLSRLSSSSYSVWHFSQRTSMCFRVFGGYGTMRHDS